MTTEPKPIVVIYLPKEFTIGNSGRMNAPMELMQALNGNFGMPYKNKFLYTDYWKEYYWFCFEDFEISTPRFEVFYSKDFKEIEYAELKKIIEDAIEKQKQPTEK